VCLAEYLLQIRPECVICSAKPTPHTYKPSPCPNLESLTHILLIKSQNSEEISDYDRRKNLSKSYFQAKAVKRFTIGQKIDMRTSENIWAKARIKKIGFKQDNNSKFVVVHFSVVRVGKFLGFSGGIR